MKWSEIPRKVRSDLVWNVFMVLVCGLCVGTLMVYPDLFEPYKRGAGLGMCSVILVFEVLLLCNGIYQESLYQEHPELREMRKAYERKEREVSRREKE